MVRVAPIACLAILWPACVFASNDTQGIVYDYLTGFLYRETEDGGLRRISHLPSVTAGNPVQLKVININTLKYTIEIERAEARLFTSVPSALDILLPPLPSKALITTDELTGSARAFSTGRSGPALVRATALANRVTAMADELQTLDDRVEALDNLGDINEDLVRLVRRWPDPRINPGSTPEDPRSPGRAALAQMRESAKKLVDGRTDAVVASSSDLDIRTTTKWRDMTRALTADIASRTRALERLAYEFEDDALAVAGQIEVDRSGAKEAEEAAEYMKLSSTLSRLKREVSEGVQSARDRSAAIRSTAAQREKLADSAERLFTRIMNEDVFEKAAPPVTPRGDIMRFSIRIIEPPDDADGGLFLMANPSGPPTVFLKSQEPQDPRVDVELRVVGRTKIDYSAGVFLTNLSDGSYFLSDEGGQMIVRQGARDEFSYSFGALAHVYRSSAARFVPAFSFGVAGGDSGVQLLLGASVMTGLDQRFVFTAGIIGAKVTRLNGATVGEPFKGAPSDLTTDVYRTGFFFGITFNLR